MNNNNSILFLALSFITGLGSAVLFMLPDVPWINAVFIAMFAFCFYGVHSILDVQMNIELKFNQLTRLLGANLKEIAKIVEVNNMQTAALNKLLNSPFNTATGPATAASAIFTLGEDGKPVMKEYTGPEGMKDFLAQMMGSVDETSRKSFEKMSVEELENEKKEALSNENYERAKVIQDYINKKKT